MVNLNLSPFPVLITEQLVLRQVTVEDENEIFTLRSNERVNEFLDRPKANSIAEARQFINKINDGINNNKSVYWGITFKNDYRVIGTIGFWNISKEDHAAEIGYELLPQFQRKGIMQEAFSKVIEFGFETMKLQTIEAYTRADNCKSTKLLLKNNFKRDLHAEQTVDKKEKLMNMIMYTLSNETD